MDAGRQKKRADLMKNRPEFRVVDVKRIALGVPDVAGNDLGRFDRYLPVGKTNHPDAESKQPAEEENPERAVSGRHAEIMPQALSKPLVGEPVIRRERPAFGLR